jgi:molybdopterin/thiamine biosynthesis adenylyltransferase
MTAEAALARTTRLINQEFFDGNAEEAAIAAGLTSTTIRLIADSQNMARRGGQAALVTAFQLIARMGIRIDLIAPETELVAIVPPLRQPPLRAALVDLSTDLIPNYAPPDPRKQADATFVFGDSPYEESDAICVTVGDLACRLDRAAEPARISCDYPLGALAAGAAIAAIALHTALPQIESATGLARTSRPRPNPGPPVDVDLTRIFPTLTTRSLDAPIDAISAGAITNAFVASGLWLPENTSAMRIFDDDDVAIHNINRCLQFRASDTDRPKVHVLHEASSSGLAITGINARFDPGAAGDYRPLADRVVVGVDNIPARWWIQEEWPQSLYIGATTNNEAIVTTHHPGGPCAGCAHPEAGPTPDEIPTISFVSLWAGLLQLCALLAEGAEPSQAQRITVYPFALGGPSLGTASELRPSTNCAIACPASRAADERR